jgi:hypothetical protein
MVRLHQGNMKRMMNFCGIYKFELEGQNIYLFHDGEWTKSLLVQFLLRAMLFFYVVIKVRLGFQL